MAVKIIEKSDLDEENLQKISLEIEIMRHLNHASTIRLLQVKDICFPRCLITSIAFKTSQDLKFNLMICNFCFSGHGN